MQVEILKKERILNGKFLKVEEATLRHELHNGEMSDEMKRVSVERGDSVAVLMHDTDEKKIILLEQFRYPTVEKDGGWVLELPAGTIDDDDSPEDTARREIAEESGYEVEALEHIATFYVSPGYTSERLFLYYAEVKAEYRKGEGGGKAEEGENIRVLQLSVSEALQKIESGEIKDAKTIMALWWLKLKI